MTRRVLIQTGDFDVGAEIAQHPGREGAGQDSSEIEDTETAERCVVGGLIRRCSGLD